MDGGWSEGPLVIKWKTEKQLTEEYDLMKKQAEELTDWLEELAQEQHSTGAPAMSHPPMGYCPCTKQNRSEALCGTCSRYQAGRPRIHPVQRRNPKSSWSPEDDLTMRGIEANYEQRVKGDPK